MDNIEIRIDKAKTLLKNAIHSVLSDLNIPICIAELMVSDIHNQLIVQNTNDLKEIYKLLNEDKSNSEEGDINE